jgi:hypothetical protein
LRDFLPFASRRPRDPHTDVLATHIKGGIMNDWHVDFTTDGFAHPEDDDQVS